MSAVDIFSLGTFTIAQNVPITFSWTWPGHIDDSRWVRFSANAVSDSLEVTAKATLSNEGTSSFGLGNFDYFAIATLLGETTSGNIVQVHMILMSAELDTF